MIYIKGDYVDGNPYLPNTKNNDMTWNSTLHRYELSSDIVEQLDTFDETLFSTEDDLQDFIRQQEQLCMEYLYANPYNYSSEIVEFLIARTARGREGYKRMVLAQIRMMFVDGLDLDNSFMLADRAINISKMEAYNRIGYKGNWNMRVNPDSTDPDGLYNGW